MIKIYLNFQIHIVQGKPINSTLEYEYNLIILEGLKGLIEVIHPSACSRDVSLLPLHKQTHQAILWLD